MTEETTTPVAEEVVEATPVATEAEEVTEAAEEETAPAAGEAN